MRLRTIALAILAASVLAGCARPAPRAAAARPAAAGPYIGLAGSGLPDSYAPVTQFAASTGARVRLAVYYSGWYEGFRTRFADTAWAHGTITVVNIDPPAGLAAIAAGHSDVYLRKFAAQLKAFGHPVVLAFGHEMNGDWFPYGYRHDSPAQFVAAYRHVHDVITAAGATGVTWLWTVNIPVKGQTEPAAVVYPGSRYVDWAGIDGYDWSGRQTWDEEFQPAVTAARKVAAGKPVLIAETSVVPGPHAAAQVTSLFNGIRADRLLGVVWYDTDKASFKGTRDTHDWRLEDDPGALAAFRAGVRRYG